jgi:hypothetical protein
VLLLLAATPPKSVRVKSVKRVVVVRSHKAIEVVTNGRAVMRAEKWSDDEIEMPSAAI